MFLKNNLLTFYVKSTAFVSLLFLLYQSIVLIDFAYFWNEKWVDNYDMNFKIYGVYLAAGAIVLFLLASACLIFNFYIFWISGCIYNKINLISNAIVIILLTVLVVLKFNDNSSILTSMFISLIFTYYNSSSLSSIPNDTCNPFTLVDNKSSYIYNTLAHVLVNLTLGFCSVYYSSTAKHTSKNFREAHISYNHANNTTDASLSSRSLIEELDVEAIRDHIQKEFKTSTAVYKSNEFILFHGISSLFSIYLVMIFLDWRGLNPVNNQWVQLTAPNLASFLLKTFNSIMFLLLYVWTVIAPKIYRDRF